MKKVFVIILYIVAAFHLQAQDSLTVETKYDFAAGDTMVNLNRINGCVLKFQLSEEATTILSENGLKIENPAVIIVEKPELLKDEMIFEVKCYTSESEWFINEIRYQKGKLLNVKSDKIEMATTWRKEGKIYVVLATVCLVFLGLFTYLFILDKKVSKLGK